MIIPQRDPFLYTLLPYTSVFMFESAVLIPGRSGGKRRQANCEMIVQHFAGTVVCSMHTLTVCVKRKQYMNSRPSEYGYPISRYRRK